MNSYTRKEKNNGLRVETETNRGRGGGKHHWDKQVSRDKREGESASRRERGRGKEGRSGRGMVKLASLPQAQQLHNGASLRKKVTLQTGSTGDTGVCIYVCQCV